MNDSFAPLLASLKAHAPLIHAITNPISIHQCANAILAIGARPIMAEHPREVAEITETAGALLLNLGNITDVRMESMEISAQTACRCGIPFVLDAVGVGCSSLRREYAHGLLQRFSPGILKGNYGEIHALAHPDYTASGVDGDQALSVDATANSAAALARRYGSTVLASGKADLVTDGVRAVLIGNGTPQLSRVTGTGCMLGALCSCFLTTCPPLQAAAAACVALGVAGQLAETPQGSGTFMQQLMDRLSCLDGETMQTYQIMEEYHLAS